MKMNISDTTNTVTVTSTTFPITTSTIAFPITIPTIILPPLQLPTLPMPTYFETFSPGDSDFLLLWSNKNTKNEEFVRIDALPPSIADIVRLLMKKQEK